MCLIWDTYTYTLIVLHVGIHVHVHSNIIARTAIIMLSITIVVVKGLIQKKFVEQSGHVFGCRIWYIRNTT